VFRSTVSTLMLALLLSAPALAQDAPLPAMSELKAALAPGKQSLVSRQLGLTPAEEADFWPVYDELQKGLQDVQQRRRQALADVGGADGERLDEIAEELLQADIDEARLHERAWDRLRERLPADKVLKYVRLEQMIATLGRYEGN